MKKSNSKPPQTKKIQSATPDTTSATKQQEPDVKTVPAIANPVPTESEKQQTYKCKPDQTPLGKQILEVIAVAAGIAALVVYSLQLSEMRKATEAATGATNIARQTLQISQRPWVSIDVQPNSDIDYAESGMYMYDLLTIKNFGTTPAVNARAEVQLVGSGVDDSIKKMCSGLEVKPFHAGDADMREAYFAGVPTYKSWILNFDPVKQGNSKEHNGTFEPILITCVAYQSSFDPDTWHHTWKAFLVTKRDPKSLNGIYVMEDGKVVQKADVILAPWTHPEGEN